MAICAGIRAASGVTLLDSAPYHSSADSPSVIAGVENLFIEDFEDGLLRPEASQPTFDIKCFQSRYQGII